MRIFGRFFSAIKTMRTQGGVTSAKTSKMFTPEVIQAAKLHVYDGSTACTATSFSTLVSPSMESAVNSMAPINEVRSMEVPIAPSEKVVEATRADRTSSTVTTLSFSSPESDFCAPSPQEIANAVERATQVAQTYSWASPESDFCMPTALELEEESMRAQEVAQTFSFSSPESDFCKPTLKRLHDDVPVTAEAAVTPSPQARVITSPIAPFRILAVNDAWMGLCGFSELESKSHTLGLLQGPKTDAAILQKLAVGAQAGMAQEAVLTNYRKDGSAFKNRLRIQPLTDGTMLGVLEEVSMDVQEGHRSMGYA